MTWQQRACSHQQGEDTGFDMSFVRMHQSWVPSSAGPLPLLQKQPLHLQKTVTTQRGITEQRRCDWFTKLHHNLQYNFIKVINQNEEHPAEELVRYPRVFKTNLTTVYWSFLLICNTMTAYLQRHQTRWLQTLAGRLPFFHCCRTKLEDKHIEQRL